MTVRRYAWLTNAFSKKIENHASAGALGYFAYSSRSTARYAGRQPWRVVSQTGCREVSDLVALLERHAQKREKRKRT